MRSIELNADVGEGFDDAALLGLVDRASIACGGHAGDDASMRLALERCRALGVVAGAHPSYADREGFGRRAMAAEPGALVAEIASQIRRLAAVATEVGLELAHVKPHGALYLAAWRDRATAAAIVEAVAAVDRRLTILAPHGSALLAASAAHGLATLREGFVDRRYLTSGELAPRHLPGALVEELAAAVGQGVALARREAVPALDGGSLRLDVESLCLHGDAPRAVALAVALRRALQDGGFDVRAATVRPAATRLRRSADGSTPSRHRRAGRPPRRAGG